MIQLLLLSKNNKLLLKIGNKQTRISFVNSARYKIKIRRYVKLLEQDTIVFKDDLTIHDMKRISDIVCTLLPNVIVDQHLNQYIENRNFYIEQRYRLGNDIKKKSEHLHKQFHEFSSVVNNIMIRPLTTEQMWNAFYMSVMRNVSNFSVPGSGKTATVLGTFAYLKEKEIVNKIVMIGPKNSFGSWIDEFKLCFKTNDDNYYLNIHKPEYHNSEQRKFVLRFDSGGRDLILINYESLPSLNNVIKEIIDEKTLLVFDEVHKIKKPTGQRARVAKDVSINAGSIIALTGTPIPNSYEDIYNIFNILYREDYKDFFGFTTNELKNASQDEINNINEKIKPFFCRISKEDLNVPPANEDSIFDFSVSHVEEKIFKILYQTYKNNLFALLVRIFQLESNPQLLLKEIDYQDFLHVIDDESDFSEDITVRNYSEDITELVSQISITTKTKRTIDLIEQLVSENKKAIVWCIFVSSIHLLEKICIRKGIKVKCIYGEIPLEKRLHLINDFKNGEFDILITNPHTLAESVSLHTVCHDAIYYEYSFNLVHLLQSKDRIHRLGLPENQYTQYYFLKSHYTYNQEDLSIAGRIYDRLKEKEEIMLNAIDNDILEHISSYKEDLKIIFNDL